MIIQHMIIYVRPWAPGEGGNTGHLLDFKYNFENVTLNFFRVLLRCPYLTPDFLRAPVINKKPCRKMRRGEGYLLSTAVTHVYINGQYNMYLYWELN